MVQDEEAEQMKDGKKQTGGGSEERLWCVEDHFLCAGINRGE